MNYTSVFMLKMAVWSHKEKTFFNKLLLICKKKLWICFDETCSKLRISKYFSEAVSIQNSLEQVEILSSLLLNFALEYTIRNVHENQEEV